MGWRSTGDSTVLSTGRQYGVVDIRTLSRRTEPHLSNVRQSQICGTPSPGDVRLKEIFFLIIIFLVCFKKKMID